MYALQTVDDSQEVYVEVLRQRADVEEAITRARVRATEQPTLPNIAWFNRLCGQVRLLDNSLEMMEARQ